MKTINIASAGHGEINNGIINEDTIYLKGLLSNKLIESIKSKIFDILRYHNAVDSASNGSIFVEDGKPFFENFRNDWAEIYTKILSIPELCFMPLNTELLGAVQQLIGKTEILPHSQVIVRSFANLPLDYATPPHIDYTWNGGSNNAWTAWIPLVEITPEMGGLILWPGTSNTPINFVNNDPRQGIKDIDEKSWTSALYEAGDVCFFKNSVVHAAKGNFSKNKLRLSMECRFQPLADPIRTESLLPHWNAFGGGWEKVYADIVDTRKYYWIELKPNIVDDSINSYKQDIKARALQTKIQLKMSKHY